MPTTSDVNVARLLLAALERRPAAEAIGTVALTYAGLVERAGAFQASLAAIGFAPGDRAAILLERGGDAAAAMAATHAAGGLAVVVNDRLRARQVEHILADAEATVLVTRPAMLERLHRPLASAVPVLMADALPAEGLLRPLARAGGEGAQIIYTSGSTGMPRGVVFSHSAMRAGIAVCIEYLGLTAGDRVAGLLPISSVYGLNQLLCALAVGATYVPLASPLPADVVRALSAQAVTVLAAVPPLWQSLLGVPEFTVPLPSLRQLQNAGGHLPAETVRRLRSAQPAAQLFLQYGMTETWRGTFLPPAEVDRRPTCMGRPVAGAEMLVVRPDGTPCAADETGELVHSAPTLADGYWRDPEATAAVFRPHPTRPGVRAVYTGDLVRRDADGWFYFVARRDRLIKSQGFRVGPDEIAEAFHGSGQVDDVVVTSEPDAERGERIVAYLVLAPGGSVEAAARFVRAELPPYMVPARIETRAALPRLPGGKHDLAALTPGP